MNEEELTIVIKAVNAAQDALNSATKALQGIGVAAKTASDQADDASIKWGSLMKIMLGFASAGEAVRLAVETIKRSIEGLVDSTVKAAAEQVNFSRVFGTTIQDAGRLAFAAGAAGASLDSFGRAFRTFATQAVQAQQGNQQSIDRFKLLGITVDELRKLMEQGLVPAFTVVADRLANTNNQFTRVAAGAGLLGRGFRDVVKASQEVEGGMATLNKIAEQLGVIYSNELAKSLKEVELGHYLAGQAMKGLLISMLQQSAVSEDLRKGYMALVEALVNVRIAAGADLARILRDLADAVGALSKSVLQLAKADSPLLRVELKLLEAAVDGLTKPLYALAALMDIVAAAMFLITGRFSDAGAAIKKFGRDAVDTVLPVWLERLLGIQKVTEQLGNTMGHSGNQADDYAAKVAALQKKLADLKISTDTAFASMKQASAAGGVFADFQANPHAGDATFGSPIVTLQALIENEQHLLEQTKLWGEAQKKVNDLIASGATHQQALTAAYAEAEGKLEQFDAEKKLADLKQGAEFMATKQQEMIQQTMVLTGAMSEADAAVLKVVEDAEKMHVRPELIPEIRATAAALEQAKLESKAWVSSFDLFDDVVTKVGDALVSGTLKWNEIMKSVETSIGQSFVRAFAAGLKAKLGFDNDFQINILGLVKYAEKWLTTGDGSLSGLWDSVFRVAKVGLTDQAKTAVASAHTVVDANSVAMQTVQQTAATTSTVVSAAGTQASGGWIGFFQTLVQGGQSAFGSLISMASNFLGLIGAVVSYVGGGSTGGAGILGLAAGAAGSLSNISRNSTSGIGGFISSLGAATLGKIIPTGSILDSLGLGSLSNVLGLLGGAGGVAGGVLGLITGGNLYSRLGAIVQLLGGLNTLGGTFFGSTAAGVGLAGNIASTGNPLLIGLSNLLGAGIEGPGFGALAANAASGALGTGAGAAVSGATSAASTALTTVAAVAPYVAAAVGSYLVAQSSYDMYNRKGGLPQQSDYSIFGATLPQQQLNLINRGKASSAGGVLMLSPAGPLFALMNGFAQMLGMDPLGLGPSDAEKRTFLAHAFQSRLGDVLGRSVGTSGSRGMASGGLLDILGGAGVAALGNLGLENPSVSGSLGGILRSALGGDDMQHLQSDVRAIVHGVFGNLVNTLGAFNTYLAQVSNGPIGSRAMQRRVRGVTQLGNFFDVGGVQVGDILGQHIGNEGQVRLGQALPAVRDAVIAAWQAGAGVSTKETRRLGDAYLDVVAHMVNRVSGTIDFLGLAGEFAGSGNIRALSRGVGLEQRLEAGGFRQLTPDEVASFEKAAGSGNTRRSRRAFAALTGALGIEQFSQSADPTKALSNAATAANDAVGTLDKLSQTLEHTHANTKKWHQAMQALPTDLQNAEKAVSDWGNAVLGVMQQIRDLDKAMDQNKLTWAEEQDQLTGGHSAIQVTNDLIAKNADRIRDLGNASAGAAVQIDAINYQMDLLRQQAANTISAITDTISQQRDATQKHLDTVNAQLPGVTALAALAPTGRQLTSTIRGLADTTGIQTAQDTQGQLAAAVAKFMAATDDTSRAAAAQAVLQLAGQLPAQAAAAFGSLSPTTAAMQQSSLAAIALVQPTLDQAEVHRDALLQQQADDVAKIAKDNDDIATWTKAINQWLAKSLSVWEGKVVPLMQQQRDGLFAQLHAQFPSLSTDDLNALIADPTKASLFVQQAQLTKLTNIDNTLRTMAGLPAISMAGGGDFLVTRPTMFVAGDAGPEYASFRPMGRGHTASNVAIHVHVQHGPGSTPQQAQLFGRTAATAAEAEVMRMLRVGTAGGSRLRRGVR